MATPKQGFIASRSGGIQPILALFEHDTTQDKTLAPGDPVRLTSTGRVALVTASTSTAIVGVVDAVGLKDAATGAFKPLTFNQPTRGAFLTSGQAGYAQVNINPQQRYIVQCDVTASVGNIGNSVFVSGAVPSTAYGWSRYNVATPGTSTEGQFKIVGIAPTEQITGFNVGDKASGSGVEVIISPAMHYFNNGNVV